jgi:ubiquinone/menaquinone biosynthesis C-methylase UbiE
MLFPMQQPAPIVIKIGSPQLDFSEKYTAEHAEKYFSKHQLGFWRVLSNRRETAIARKALKLAGNPGSVLDLPSGTGRFWEMLCEQPNRKIIAADNSRNMFEIGMQKRPKEITRRIDTLQCSAFDIPLPDHAVENIFCMRLVHHVGKSDDRITLFREFNRVASKTVCLSLWVDGSLKAYKRRKLEARRGQQADQNRFVLQRSQVESEFRQAGMGIIGHVDFLKVFSMWRVYVLGTTGN